MRIRFIGGQESSMGSMTLLETENTSLLIDCGLYRRTDLDSRHINRRFMFDPAVIRAVVLTDARAERAGNLPTLIRAGFRGDIYGTPATHDLCALMLTDILAKGTDLLVSGEMAAVERAFGRPSEAGVLNLPDVMSRKKQVAPKLMAATAR